MKQLPLGKFYSIKTLFCTAFLVLGFSITSTAQLSLSWRATSASIADDYFHMQGTPEWLNCDMYTDMSSGSIGASLIAAVWDEDQGGGTYVCSLGVYDPASGTRYLLEIAQDAKHPDIVILDDRQQSQGDTRAAIVYEDHSGSPIEVKYVEVSIGSMMGVLGTPSLTLGTATTISNNSYDAFNPHIDGLMEEYFANTSQLYWGAGNSYEPLTIYAATWTENNTTSGNLEIYTITGLVNTTPGSGNYVVDGDWSDIGAVHVLQAGSPYDMGYISYVDASGVLKVVDYDYGTNTVGSPVTLENSVTIVANPRIDALNVIDPVSSPLLPWMAVAQVDNGGVNQVRSYEPTGSPITLNDYATQSPLSITSPMYEAHKPSVATGPGPDGKSPAVVGEYGNQHYIQSFRIAPGQMQALDRDLDVNAATSTWDGYYDINKDLLDNTSVFGTLYLSAVATSSNCGVGHASVWHNFTWDGAYPKVNTHVIGYKYTTAGGLTFKPTSAATTTKEDKELSGYPNPATSVVTINGLKANATYTVIDVSGKVLSSGSITPSNSDIDVSSMPNGVYMFNVTEGDTFTSLKFVKQ